MKILIVSGHGERAFFESDDILSTLEKAVFAEANTIYAVVIESNKGVRRSIARWGVIAKRLGVKK